MDSEVILLIEDSEDDANFFSKKIEAELGIPVNVIAPPPRSIDDLLLMLKDFDLLAVIADEKLPETSSAEYLGIDALGEIRNLYPTIPLIVLTNYPGDYPLEEHGGVIDYVWDKNIFNEEISVMLQRLSRHIDRSAEHSNNEDKINKEWEKLLALLSNDELSKDEVTPHLIEYLVTYHFQLEPTLEKVFWFPEADTDKNAVPLLEVSRGALPTGSVEPFSLAPTEEFPFRLIVADITPSELEKIKKGEIELPNSWKIDEANEFDRSILEN